MYKQVYLKRGKKESLLHLHPWIFSGAINKIEEGLGEDDVVRVMTYDKKSVAVGHFQIGSVAIRVLSFHNVKIDGISWKGHLKAALRVHQATGVIREESTETGLFPNATYCLVHDEGDNLPGLIIDIYGKTTVMQTHSVGMHACREVIAKALIKVISGRSNGIYCKNETTLPYKADLGQEDGFIYGDTNNNIVIKNDLKFHIDWLKGQKTGFFIDQCEDRSLLEHYAKGRSVLNMPYYTSGFSVCAMRGGTKVMYSADSSAEAIELTNKNVELNFPNDSRHEAICEDAFKYLDGNDGKYDLIILDPPAFAKHRNTLKNGLRGYTRLNVKGFEKIKPGEILFIFSCPQVVTRDNFRQAAFTAAVQAERKVRILHQIHQPADHPINIYHPEGEYLEGLVLYVGQNQMIHGF